MPRYKVILCGIAGAAVMLGMVWAFMIIVSVGDVLINGQAEEGRKSMRKPFRFNELSAKKCSTKGCQRKIKKNVLDRKPGTELCFDCYRALQAGRGRFMNTAREIRTGKPRHVQEQGRNSGTRKQQISRHIQKKQEKECAWACVIFFNQKKKGEIWICNQEDCPW